MDTYVELDQKGRVGYVRRGLAATPIMETTYEYRDDDLVSKIIYGDSALPNSQIEYTYDIAMRLIEIDHQNSIGTTQLKLTYTYTNNDLPWTIAESDLVGTFATTTFEYDTRNRLTSEKRDLSNPTAVEYDFDYSYDDGGNRKTKTNNVTNTAVIYTYDYQAPGIYKSNNNRLKTAATYSQSLVLLSTTWYYYNLSGNVTRVVTRLGAGGGGGQQQSSSSSSSTTTLEGSTIEGGGAQAMGPGGPGGYCSIVGGDHYTATRFEYADNGGAVTAVAGEQWCWDTGCPGKYDVTFAREFRYDGSRQRYLDRQLDPVMLEAGAYVVVENGDTWSDYSGNGVYGDYTVDAGVVTNSVSYAPGTAKVSPWTNSGSSSTDYYHTDDIGTTQHMTDSAGAKTEVVVYTAFGERISGSSTRYGYVGTFGYQTHSEMEHQHVGARYYDPSSGRFLQRDPIGIDSGFNVYEYSFNTPTVFIDPSGLSSIEVAVATGALTAAEAAELLGGVAVAYVAGKAIAATCQKVTKTVRRAKRKKPKVHRTNRRKSNKKKHQDGETRRNQRRTDKKRQPGKNWKPNLNKRYR